MQTTVEALEGNKVKLHVAVPAGEFERAIDAAFRKLAHEVRIPGFRPGKAPRQLLEARFGIEAAREQALRDSLPEYYVEAVREHDVDVIAVPDIEITAGHDEGDVEFDAVVEVRPVVTLVGHDELRVELPFALPTDDEIEAQLVSFRERFGELVDSDHPLTDDAFASIDITGSIDGEELGALTANDFLYRVGSEGVVPELDEHLRGARPGAILEFTATLPERFGELAGQDASFRVIVKSVQQRVLPDLTDEWVGEVSEFSTVDELRSDVRKRLETIGKVRGQMAVRDKVIEAAAALVPVAPPESLVDQEVQRRVREIAHDLSHRGVELEQYLLMTGQEPQTFLDSLRDGAATGVLADLAIRAVVAQEAIEATDAEVDAEIERIAERTGEKVQKLRRQLEKGDLLEAVRSDIARGKAVQFLVDHATVVDEHGETIDLVIDAEDIPALPGTAEDTDDDTDSDVAHDAEGAEA
ncbi:MAG TPA: trigger factor [Acidimicrobiia bacterium]|nr:trigger factor [Acidimicrobiia bacterium]